MYSLDPSNFPQDDQLWFVKYVDQFNLAFKTGRTPSVQVMLQQLPTPPTTELHLMDKSKVQSFLGRRRSEAQQRFEFASIIVGELPLVRIGDVIKNGVKVGSLPSKLHRLHLRPGSQELREVRIKDPVTPLPGWTPKACQILNPFEYSGMTDHHSQDVRFNDSRVLVYKKDHGNGQSDTYIIPRTTIFRSFYACHNELANAIYSDSWPNAIQKLVSFNETYGGLRTGVADGGKQWNIVLQTLVPDDYRALLAVLHFDDHARKLATSIYSQALKERQLNRWRCWYASASIPFQPINEDLILSIQCLQLRSWGMHRKFLVTDINGSNWPSHYPIIGHSRTNDGQSSTTWTSVAQTQPYANRAASKEATDETVLRSGVDADASSSTTTIKGEHWDWIGPGPTYRRLEKDRSQRYEGAPPVDSSEGSQVSAGARTHENITLPKAEVKIVVRAPNARFEHMWHALQVIQEKGVIADLTSVPATRVEQQGRRSGFDCWKFIDANSIRKRLKPSGKFRTIYDVPRDRRSAHWRTAVVFSFKYRQRVHYLIEIECNNKQTFKSPLLSIGMPSRANTLIELALDVIAVAKGKNLKTCLPEALAHEFVTISVYIHKLNPSGSLKIDSLEKFLAKHGTL